MAYKYTIGSQTIGDLTGSDDPDRNTAIDFEDDYIGFITSGSTILSISGSDVYLTNGANLYLDGGSNLYFDSTPSPASVFISEVGDGSNSLNIDANNVLYLTSDESVRIMNNSTTKVKFDFNNDVTEFSMPISSSLPISASSIHFADSIKVAGAPAGQDTVIDSQGNIYGNAIDTGVVSASAIVLTDDGSPVYQLPTSDGSSGQAMVTDGAGNLSFSTISGGGGGGSIGGSNTQIQFNNNGNLGASSKLTFDGSTLGIDGTIEHENYSKISYPSNMSNTGSYAKLKSYIREVFYTKYDWPNDYTPLFKIQPYDERTGEPYTGSNIYGVVAIEATINGVYNSTSPSSFYSVKAMLGATWNAGTVDITDYPYASIGAPSTFLDHFQDQIDGSAATFRFGYQAGVGTTGPMTMHFKIQTGYPAGSDGRYIYWVFTELFSGSSE